MKIEFLKAYQLGAQTFKPGDCLEVHADMLFELMNDKYYMFILNGLRYDILKEDVKIIQYDDEFSQ